MSCPSAASRCSRSARSKRASAAARYAARRARGAPRRPGKPSSMPKARVAVLLSGNGTTMSSLLFASRLPDAPYQIVLVAGNDPAARGLAIARAEGLATFAHRHKGLECVVFFVFFFLLLFVF